MNPLFQIKSSQAININYRNWLIIWNSKTTLRDWQEGGFKGRIKATSTPLFSIIVIYLKLIKNRITCLYNWFRSYNKIASKGCAGGLNSIVLLLWLNLNLVRWSPVLCMLCVTRHLSALHSTCDAWGICSWNPYMSRQQSPLCLTQPFISCWGIVFHFKAVKNRIGIRPNRKSCSILHPRLW